MRAYGLLDFCSCKLKQISSLRSPIIIHHFCLEEISEIVLKELQFDLSYCLENAYCNYSIPNVKDEMLP